MASTEDRSRKGRRDASKRDGDTDRLRARGARRGAGDRGLRQRSNSGDSGDDSGGSTSGVPTVDASGKPSGELTISNWPLYIDKQTIPDFEDATGVSVKYIEDVNDNAEFFGKVQPQLDQGESGGRSIFVVTDWMADKMHELGYLQNFDKTAMTNNLENLIPSLAHPPFDINRDYSMPWQTGMTGLVCARTWRPT